jgi:hypothetical protein
MGGQAEAVTLWSGSFVPKCIRVAMRKIRQLLHYISSISQTRRMKACSPILDISHDEELCLIDPTPVHVPKLELNSECRLALAKIHMLLPFKLKLLGRTSTNLIDVNDSTGPPTINNPVQKNTTTPPSPLLQVRSLTTRISAAPLLTCRLGNSNWCYYDNICIKADTVCKPAGFQKRTGRRTWLPPKTAGSLCFQPSCGQPSPRQRSQLR